MRRRKLSHFFSSIVIVGHSVKGVLADEVVGKALLENKNYKPLNHTYIFVIFIRIKFFMNTKLTLKLNEEVIAKAKAYASNKKMSLSRIVEAYLQHLTSEKENADFEISPFVKSIATGTQIPSDLDYKSDYANHLSDKYK